MLPAPFGKVKLTIEYDGTNYRGWQRQGQGQPSIQGTIEKAIQTLYQSPQIIHLMGAGRTDTGVHAINQIAHFIPPKESSRINFVHAFQSLIPSDIIVKKAEIVPADFHARHAAAKTYLYRIWNKPIPSALRARYSLWIRLPLDVEKLNRAARYLIGTYDFNSFRSEGSRVGTTTRTIFAAQFEMREDYLEFRIKGSGFLKQMVRNIVGTLIQTQLGDRSIESLPDLIAARDRRQAGPTAEPQGLYLEEIFYG